MSSCEQATKHHRAQALPSCMPQIAGPMPQLLQIQLQTPDDPRVPRGEAPWGILEGRGDWPP
eukprot:3487729-Amphidinium_carterae.1